MQEEGLVCCDSVTVARAGKYCLKCRLLEPALERESEQHGQLLHPFRPLGCAARMGRRPCWGGLTPPTSSEELLQGFLMGKQPAHRLRCRAERVLTATASLHLQIKARAPGWP